MAHHIFSHVKHRNGILCTGLKTLEGEGLYAFFFYISLFVNNLPFDFDFFLYLRPTLTSELPNLRKLLALTNPSNI